MRVAGGTPVRTRAWPPGSSRSHFFADTAGDEASAAEPTGLDGAPTSDDTSEGHPRIASDPRAAGRLSRYLVNPSRSPPSFCSV